MKKKSKKNFSKIWSIFGQKCKSIAFTFSSKFSEFWPKNFFPTKIFFLCSMDSGCPKNETKSKKKFSKIWSIFGQKCKSIAFTFSSKIVKFLRKNFFPKKIFFYVLWTQDIQKMKKKMKKKIFKFLAKFSQFCKSIAFTVSSKYGKFLPQKNFS